jgi:hypothetical protein
VRQFRRASCVNVKFDLLANQFSKILGGLYRLQAAIEFDCRLDAAVSKYPPDPLIVPRPVLEIDRCRGVTKLMNSYPKSSRFLDALSNLLNMSLFFG